MNLYELMINNSLFRNYFSLALSTEKDLKVITISTPVSRLWWHPNTISYKETMALWRNN